MILGVVVAYITAYLMHFNIEISSAIKPTDNYFDWDCRFRTWARRSADTPEEWVWQKASKFKEFDPQFMRYVTPFNFMYVCWDDFAGIVNEILDAWKNPDRSVFVELAKGAYRRLRARGEYLQTPAVRTRMYSWKQWKGNPGLLYGMARKKSDRDALEKYEKILGNPYDYLMTSVSGHKMEHTNRVLDIYSVCQPLDEFAGEIDDVFPGAPKWCFPFPKDEEGLRAYRAREDAMGGTTKKRQDQPDDLTGWEHAPKKKPKGSSSHKTMRAKPSQTGESPSESLSTGWLAPIDQLEYLDEHGVLVQRDVNHWGVIKENLRGLAESATSLAQTAQKLSSIAEQMNTHTPQMITWMDKVFENRVSHSQRMREKRLIKKQQQDTPQGDSLVGGTIGSLAIVPGPIGGMRYDRDESYPRGPGGTGGSSSISSRITDSKHRKQGGSTVLTDTDLIPRKGPTYRAAGTI